MYTSIHYETSSEKALDANLVLNFMVFIKKKSFILWKIIK